jgi:N-acetyl-gamma-glutamyl-phosphate reductase
VAAPGCFPTASLLALTPFLKQGLIETSGIVVDAKTGTSGGGRAAKEHLLLAEASEGVAPYGVVGHRHTSEIEQLASQAAGQSVQVQFTPHLMPMVRGLLATVYARLRDPGLTAEDCTVLLGAAYRHTPCVEVLPVGSVRLQTARSSLVAHPASLQIPRSLKMPRSATKIMTLVVA